MRKSIAVLVLLIVFSASSVKAQEAKNYCIGLHGVHSQGGDIERSKIGFGAQAGFKFNENFSLELALSHFSDEYEEAGILLEQDLTTIGISAISRTSVTEGVKVYLLGGLNYNIADVNASIDPAVYGSIDADVDVDDEMGFHIGAGMTFHILNNWDLFAEYRYTFLKLEGDVSTSFTGTYLSERIKGDYDFGLLKTGINYLF